MLLTFCLRSGVYGSIRMDLSDDLEMTLPSPDRPDILMSELRRDTEVLDDLPVSASVITSIVLFLLRITIVLETVLISTVGAFACAVPEAAVA